MSLSISSAMPSEISPYALSPASILVPVETVSPVCAHVHPEDAVRRLLNGVEGERLHQRFAAEKLHRAVLTGDHGVGQERSHDRLVQARSRDVVDELEDVMLVPLVHVERVKAVRNDVALPARDAVGQQQEAIPNLLGDVLRELAHLHRRAELDFDLLAVLLDRQLLFVALQNEAAVRVVELLDVLRPGVIVRLARVHAALIGDLEGAVSRTISSPSG